MQAGEELDYTLVIDNLGPSWAHTVVVSDVLSTDGQFDIVGIDADLLGNRQAAACTIDAPQDSIFGATS